MEFIFSEICQCSTIAPLHQGARGDSGSADCQQVDSRKPLLVARHALPTQRE